MIEEARRRALGDGVAERCRFNVSDISALEVEGTFDLVLGVTVLQHIIDAHSLRAALLAMSSRVAPGGRIVLLEAAPTEPVNRCDTTVFKARPRESYLDLFRDCNLEVTALTGVDPAPFRSRLLPHVRSLPRALSMGLIALTTLLSLPINGFLGRLCPAASWHAVFVLRPGRRA
jgi:SAM-dependent methyltransferase